MSITTAAPATSVLPVMVLDPDGALCSETVVVTAGNVPGEAVRDALGPSIFHPTLHGTVDGWQVWGDRDAALWDLPANPLGSALLCQHTGTPVPLRGRLVFAVTDEHGAFTAPTVEQVRALGGSVRGLIRLREALAAH